jgi:hypothetical protein
VHGFELEHLSKARVESHCTSIPLIPVNTMHIFIYFHAVSFQVAYTELQTESAEGNILKASPNTNPGRNNDLGLSIKIRFQYIKDSISVVGLVEAHGSVNIL